LTGHCWNKIINSVLGQETANVKSNRVMKRIALDQIHCPARMPDICRDNKNEAAVSSFSSTEIDQAWTTEQHCAALDRTACRSKKNPDEMTPSTRHGTVDGRLAQKEKKNSAVMVKSMRGKHSSQQCYLRRLEHDEEEEQALGAER
jgi:hypothetical protein